MTLAIAIIGLATAVAAAAAAIGSWRAAKQLLGIERRRQHIELRPQFTTVCTTRQDGTDYADLIVTFTGPPDLCQLDQVTIKILDEVGSDHWGHRLPTGVTQQEADRFVWGPWQFNTGAAVQVADTRNSRPRSYSLTDGKNWDHLSLIRTTPGHWMSTSTDEWKQRFAGQPLRLLIRAHGTGYEPWTLLQVVMPDSAQSPTPTPQRLPSG